MQELEKYLLAKAFQQETSNTWAARGSKYYTLYGHLTNLASVTDSVPAKRPS
jgi:hypothetical protein